MTDGVGIVKGFIGGCIAAGTVEAASLFSGMHALFRMVMPDGHE